MTFTSENPNKRLSSELKKSFTRTRAHTVGFGVKEETENNGPLHTAHCSSSVNSVTSLKKPEIFDLFFLEMFLMGCAPCSTCFVLGFFSQFPLHLWPHDESWQREMLTMTAESRAHRELTPSSSGRQRELWSESEQSELNRVGGVKKWGAGWKAISLSTGFTAAWREETLSPFFWRARKSLQPESACVSTGARVQGDYANWVNDNEIHQLHRGKNPLSSQVPVTLWFDIAMSLFCKSFLSDHIWIEVLIIYQKIPLITYHVYHMRGTNWILHHMSQNCCSHFSCLNFFQLFFNYLHALKLGLFGSTFF